MDVFNPRVPDTYPVSEGWVRLPNNRDELYTLILEKRWEKGRYVVDNTWAVCLEFPGGRVEMRAVSFGSARFEAAVYHSIEAAMNAVAERFTAPWLAYAQQSVDGTFKAIKGE